MDDKEKKIVCWLAMTRYCAGIFLYNPKNVDNCFLERAMIVPFTSYKLAISRIEKEAEIEIDIRTLKPNRLYRIKDNNVYVVFYNKLGVGFTRVNSYVKFLRKQGLNQRYLKNIYNLNYQEAVALVTNLGAITGRGEIFMTRSPKPNVWYKRAN